MKTTKNSKSNAVTGKAKPGRNNNRKALGVKVKPLRTASAIRSQTASSGVAEGRLASVSTAPGLGTIRLELSNLTPAQLCLYVRNIRDGITGNEYYGTLVNVIEDLTSAETKLCAVADLVVSLEGQLKAARVMQELEVVAAKDDLRTAAAACEQLSRQEEALLSANWSLRRAAGPPQPVGIPTRLVLENNPHPGEIQARWARVVNARFYEVQATPTEGTPPPVWDDVLVQSAPRARITWTNQTVGGYLSVRTRAVGARGAGPWCDPVTARVQ